MIIYTLIYVPVRLLTLKKVTTLGHEILRLLLHLTVIAILSQTLTPEGNIANFQFKFSPDEQYYNFIPFYALWRMFRMSGQKLEYFLVVNILGNILIFVPVGILHRLTKRCEMWRTVLFGALLSLTIEVCQFVLPRTTDIDDLILNTAGTFLGVVLCLWAERKISGVSRDRENGKRRKQKTV